MGQFKFVVFTNPVAGREDAYNDWYDNTHLKEVVNVPGFAAVQRFRLHDVGRGPPPLNYLAIYEMGAATLEAAIDDLNALMKTEMTLSDTARSDDIVASVYEVCADAANPTAKASGGFTFLAMTNPVPGREAEYDTWYDTEHLRDVVNVPGFTTGERLRLRHVLLGEPKHQSLALYRMEADSREAADAINRNASQAGLVRSDAIANDGASFLLQACSPRVTAPKARAPA